MTARAALLPAAVAVIALGACDQPEMRDQPKYEAYEAASELPGGRSTLHPPAGTVARGETLGARAPRPAPSAAALERGRRVFDTACAPCHSPLGDGRGMVVLRGFPPPPSFHVDRLRQAPDRHFYDVITNGFGVMYAYAGRVQPADRWAVVDYVRALQLSQNAAVAGLPDALRERLEGPR